MARHFGILKHAAVKQRQWYNPEAPMDDVNGDFPFRYTPDPDPARDANHAFWKIGVKIVAVFACLFVGMAVLMVACSAAKAHDHKQPELNAWYAALHNRNGVPCCDGSEATRIEDADWQSQCMEGECHYRSSSLATGGMFESGQ